MPMPYQHSTLRGYARLIVGEGCDMRGMKRGRVGITRVLMIGFMALSVPFEACVLYAHRAI